MSARGSVPGAKLRVRPILHLPHTADLPAGKIGPKKNVLIDWERAPTKWHEALSDNGRSILFLSGENLIIPGSPAL
jgi:hypothetical protein